MARIGRGFPSRPTIKPNLAIQPAAPPIVSNIPATASVAAYNVAGISAKTSAIGASVTVVGVTAAANIRPPATGASVVVAGINATVVTGDNAQATAASVIVAGYNASVATTANVTPLTATVLAAGYNALIGPFDHFPIPSIQIAFQNNPFDSQSAMTWTDIRPYVETLTTEIGLMTSLDSTTAGTLSGVVSNVSGNFSPWNTNSPYYSSNNLYGMVPEKTIRVLAQ